MFDERLIRMINRGRCFALIGSGPSCEVGYPSWGKLAEETYNDLRQRKIISDDESYQTYLKKHNPKYPEMFRQAEVDLGEEGRIKLINLVKKLLAPDQKKPGIIYNFLVSWPFACYLTTNYDDEINGHLNILGHYMEVLRNRKQDFYPIRDGATDYILKLHSDLEHPDETILTSLDYSKFFTDDSGQYFRDKLRMIFETFDILIIGHSVSDPDIDFILRTAKKNASPSHPIYMIASEFTAAQERDFYEKYNIILIRYKNADGNHAKLKQLLKRIDNFIVKRKTHPGAYTLTERPLEEIEGAAALFLFRKLQKANSSLNLSPLILLALTDISKPGIELNEISSRLPINQNQKDVSEFKEKLKDQLLILLDNKLVAGDQDLFWITEPGFDQVKEVKTIREKEKSLAFGQFVVDLKSSYPNLSAEQERKCSEFAEDVLVKVFEKRGLVIANKIFSGHSANPEELSDIFKFTAEASNSLSDLDLSSAFLESMSNLILHPNESQKSYLASLSQGYFLFHMFGLDPSYSKLRREIFQHTVWFCDSSVLLPLAAIGCYTHKFTEELFLLLKDAGSAVFTTPKLLQEAWEHFEWAVNFVRNNNIESPEFLRASLVMGSFKQNLFIDGYIQASADGEVGTFKDYLEMICPGELDSNSFNDIFYRNGIQLLNLDELEGFEQKDWGDVEEAKDKIKTKRIEIGTFRSNFQVETEAEIFILINNLQSGKYSLGEHISSIESAYFISQSRLLNMILHGEGKSVTTWTSETVYLYLSSLPDRITDPNLLQQCLLHEYYYAGISFIDKKKYMRFFGPSVDAAKITYNKEKKKYIDSVEKKYSVKLDEAFEKIPDLEKPFFVAQMGWRLAEEAEAATKLATEERLEAKSKIKQLEKEKAEAWKKKDKKINKQDAARQRHLKDPKHARKRLRQAQKRRKKK